MTNKMDIKNALVVLSSDLIRPDKPKQSPLIERAVELARITGCELELFHVCYDSGLENQLFESKDDLNRLRKNLIDRDATILAEMAARLHDEAIKVKYEVRWDAPRTDAILRKIAQAKPDVVMKQSRDRSFILGITSNTDWDLARRSPAHLWLVDDSVSEINRIVAAVGNKIGDATDITTTEDFHLLANARMIGSTFKSKLYPVNAYRVDTPAYFGAGMPGALAPVSISAAEQQELRAELVEKHRSAVNALAEYFSIPKSDVQVLEGHPSKVVPKFAESVDADMIIMGARNIGRLERIVSAVTVEPVMADTKCDIMIVRESESDEIPEVNVNKKPIYGVPKYDLEHAITNPEATFDSPQQVAKLPEISIELRNRILQAWEYDIRAEMATENEGGAVREIDVNALDEISSAKELLGVKQQQYGSSQISLQ